MNADQAREALADALARVAPEADLDAIDPEADLREELDLDSMDVLGLMVALSETTGVDISEDDYAGLDRVSAVVAFLTSRSAAQAGRA